MLSSLFVYSFLLKEKNKILHLKNATTCETYFNYYISYLLILPILLHTFSYNYFNIFILQDMTPPCKKNALFSLNFFLVEPLFSLTYLSLKCLLLLHLNIWSKYETPLLLWLWKCGIVDLNITSLIEIYIVVEIVIFFSNT